jgi:hypothetical protein
MARYVITSAVALAFVNYQNPGRNLKIGAVVELSAAEVTAIGAGSMRAISTTTMHDTLGESFGVSNSA